MFLALDLGDTLIWIERAMRGEEAHTYATQNGYFWSSTFPLLFRCWHFHVVLLCTVLMLTNFLQNGHIVSPSYPQCDRRLSVEYAQHCATLCGILKTRQIVARL